MSEPRGSIISCPILKIIWIDNIVRNQSQVCCITLTPIRKWKIIPFLLCANNTVPKLISNFRQKSHAHFPKSPFVMLQCLLRGAWVSVHSDSEHGLWSPHPSLITGQYSCVISAPRVPKGWAETFAANSMRFNFSLLLILLPSSLTPHECCSQEYY